MTFLKHELYCDMLCYTQQQTLPKAEHQAEHSMNTGWWMQDGVYLKRSWHFSKTMANMPLFLFCTQPVRYHTCSNEIQKYQAYKS